MLPAVIIVAASTTGYTNLMYLLGAIFAGGLVQVIYQWWRNRTRGPIEDRDLIANSIRTDIGALKDLVSEYRLESELTKRQMGDYRDQLGLLTRELARAQVRISQLEDQLHDARENRRRLETELSSLMAERDQLEKQRGVLAEESGRLRERIARLEALSERSTEFQERWASPTQPPAD